LDKWRIQDARARFSEFLDAAIKRGPQIVTRRGVETAVLVPIEQWHRLHAAARLSLKEWLLGPGPRFDVPVPRRGKLRRRPIVEFE